MIRVIGLPSQDKNIVNYSPCFNTLYFARDPVTCSPQQLFLIDRWTRFALRLEKSHMFGGKTLNMRGRKRVPPGYRVPPGSTRSVPGMHARVPRHPDTRVSAFYKSAGWNFTVSSTFPFHFKSTISVVTVASPAVKQAVKMKTGNSTV